MYRKCAKNHILTTLLTKAIKMAEKALEIINRKTEVKLNLKDVLSLDLEL